MHDVKALWATEEMERSKKVHNFSIFMCIDKDKKEHFQKASVHICFVWRQVCSLGHLARAEDNWTAERDWKEEVQNIFSSVLTVPPIMIIFRLGLGKSWS